MKSVVFFALLLVGTGTFSQPPYEELTENDKLIILYNMRYDTVVSMISDFHESYTGITERYRPITRIYQLDTAIALTFPYDINFKAFYFMTHYFLELENVEENRFVLGWTTAPAEDPKLVGTNIPGKKVMMYDDLYSRSYSAMLLTTSEGEKYDFRFITKVSLYPWPDSREVKEYQEPPFPIKKLKRKKYLELR